jgi:hypothetical protein
MLSFFAMKLALSLLALVLAACSATPPPRWVEGGSPIEIPRARWQRGAHVVDIMPDGHVLIDGEHVFSIDRAGRVIEADGTPIAVLMPEGALVGRDDASLGSVGLRNAAPPRGRMAWISIGEKGEVLRYDDEGDALSDGFWTNCGAAVRACTLTTQVVSLAEARQRMQGGFATLSGPGVGIGVGTGLVIVP